jgi:hypothetical protein
MLPSTRYRSTDAVKHTGGACGVELSHRTTLNSLRRRASQASFALAHRTVKPGKVWMGVYRPEQRRRLSSASLPGLPAAALDESMREMRIMGVRAPMVAATTWVPAHAKSGPSGGGTIGVRSAPGCDPQDHCYLFRRDSILAPAYKADKSCHAHVRAEALCRGQGVGTRSGHHGIGAGNEHGWDRPAHGRSGTAPAARGMLASAAMLSLPSEG